MCIDYRKLNQKLVKDKFPLPLIEDVLDTLQEAKVYSTLVLRNGFFHVDVKEDCRKSRRWKVTPRVLHVEDEKYSRRKVWQLRTIAFQKTMQKKELITRIARWELQLEEFDYEIEHRAGSRMKHVDALSRYLVMIVCNDTLTSKLK
ncbi:transposon Ty3-I Gag-Pol polyprotein [Trichonephila clavipes]|nr:transposon Ty3-I Gag-Pol polyprotein [Trichonephila clavipes]